LRAAAPPFSPPPPSCCGLLGSKGLRLEKLGLPLVRTLERIGSDIPTNILLAAQLIDVVMYLRQDDVLLLPAARKLGHLDQVEGLGPCLFGRVVHQHGVGLVPPPAPLVVRVHALHGLGIPDGGEALVALDVCAVLVLRKTEAVAAPDTGELVAEVRRDDGLGEPVDVVGH